MMEAGARCRDFAVGMRQLAAEDVFRPSEHHRPRGREGTHPGRNSHVWNVLIPMGSGPWQQGPVSRP